MQLQILLRSRSATWIALAVLLPASLAAFIRPAPETGARDGFVHAVYFWMNEEVTPAEKVQFEEILRGFAEIESVRSCFVGTPAGTPRKVVDNSYDYALIVTFDDKAGHDYYQAHALHKEAKARFDPWIRDVRIYDAVVAPE